MVQYSQTGSVSAEGLLCHVQEAGREMHGNPLLWLRMAEACLGGYHDLQQPPTNGMNGQSSAGRAFAALIGDHEPLPSFNGLFLCNPKHLICPDDVRQH